jgi:hypothetical protein
MKAFFETTRGGLVACEIVRRYRDGLSTDWLEVRVTATGNEIYRRGEVVEKLPCHVFPRDKVRRTRFATYVTPVNWAEYGFPAPALAA